MNGKEGGLWEGPQENAKQRRDLTEWDRCKSSVRQNPWSSPASVLNQSAVLAGKEDCAVKLTIVSLGVQASLL